ncbi:MAG TPA: hypothetical protein VIM75_22155 [Ohtaekwangia sp.]|uniref:hypothetical protein n=1 Tax=Ohtaekwangia sp. TaxID=2066019 RepID=UPI002F935841
MKLRPQTVLSILCLLIAYQSHAQVRQAIDEERREVWYMDKKALELSQKFIRLDKNYYVGYMYEGSYKFNRATDYFGYKNAIKPLTKALELIEKDYDNKLNTRTSDLVTYIGVYQYHRDFSWIAELLYECYSNLEQPEEAVRILQRVKKKRMQKEFFCQPYNALCWLTHRHRYHTTEKYSFLKKSIEANESMALKYLDSAFVAVQDNYYLNARIFNPGHEQYEINGIYFYKTLIYSYNFEIDSAEYYYNLLRFSPSFSNNNYAYTKLMNGEFEETIRYFELEKKEDDFSRKNTKEFYYMLALLDVYKSDPQKGINDLHDIISRQGSTPGFGWNNLGLARGYYYNGQLFESQKHLDKASEFEEMHINTTWGPEQYDFTKNVFSYLNKERKLQSISFENTGYWYTIPALVKMAGFFADEQSDRFMLINKFGANPERDYVYYHIFSPESTISFDEVWNIIDGLDADFFIGKFNEYLREDARVNLARYYRYFIGRLLINKGKYEEAEKVLLEALSDPYIDAGHERLFQARCYEALCKVYRKTDAPSKYKNSLLAFYGLYPQLVPYSDNTMSFNLKIVGPNEDKEVKQLVAELYQCDINLLTDKDQDPDFPTATLTFQKSDSIWQVSCRVTNKTGTVLVSQDSLKIDELKGGGKKIAYNLFNIPVTTIPEYGENNYKIIAAIALIIAILWTAHRMKKSLKF